MDVAVVLRGKSMRCLTGDMAIDSVVEVWFTIYWGLHGHHLGAAAVHAHPWAVGSEGPNFESLAKCSYSLDLESLTPWGTPTSIWRAVATHGSPQTTRSW